MRKLFIAACMAAAALCANAQDPNFHIYLCFGQSNMEGAAQIEPQDKAGVSARCLMMAAVDNPAMDRKKGHWYRAIPPLCRQDGRLTPADYFARTMAEATGDTVRIGVINVAVGGVKLEAFNQDQCKAYAKTAPDWMVSKLNYYDYDMYAHLVALARIAQTEGVIKGILLHQGESDTGDKTWPERVKVIYNRLLNDLGLTAEACPLLAGQVVGKGAKGSCAAMNDIIDTLPQVIPTAHVISSDGLDCQRDHLHFTSQSYRELGRRYAREMMKLEGIK